jgi:hypothetical protein
LGSKTSIDIEYSGIKDAKKSQLRNEHLLNHVWRCKRSLGISSKRPLTCARPLGKKRRPMYHLLRRNMRRYARTSVGKVREAERPSLMCRRASHALRIKQVLLREAYATSESDGGIVWLLRWPTALCGRATTCDCGGALAELATPEAQPLCDSLMCRRASHALTSDQTNACHNSASQPMCYSGRPMPHLKVSEDP